MSIRNRSSSSCRTSFSIRFIAASSGGACWPRIRTPSPQRWSLLSLTEDFYRSSEKAASQKELSPSAAVGMLVSLIAILLSYDPDNSNPRSSPRLAGFGAAFCPLFILSLTGAGTLNGALAGMVVRAVTLLVGFTRPCSKGENP